MFSFRSNVYRYKHTYSVEIVPVCREDLVCLPPRLNAQIGGSSPLMLVWKVSNKLRLLDPLTLKAVDVQAQQFWANPFRAIANSSLLTLYYVFDVVPRGPREGKFQLSDVTIAREADFGANDRMTTVVSHLGTVLRPGSHVWGFATEGLNYSDLDMSAFRNRAMPEVVLVKKAFLGRRRNRRGRHWKLATLGMEEEDATRNAEAARDKDREEFMDELEEDPEFRATVNLLAVPNAEEILAQSRVRKMATGSDNEDDQDDDDDDDFPTVEMSELIQQTDAMRII